MSHVVAVANQKGGVGKTITSSCLSYILKSKGFKVLSISMDPQRNLDMVAGENLMIPMNDMKTPSMLQVLRGECDIEDAIVQTEIGDLARASTQLYQWTGEQTVSKEEYLAVRDDYEKLKELLDGRILKDKAVLFLKERLDPIKEKYDFVLIDTNPSLTLLTMNSIYACDYVLIPAFSEETSTTAIAELNNTIRSVNYFNPWLNIRILGILMTKCNVRSVAFRRHVKKYQLLASKIGTRLFDTKIRQSARASDYTEYHTNLVLYVPKCNTTQDYIVFAEEFLKAIKEEDAHAKKKN